MALPSFQTLWKKHEQLYLTVFSNALIKLAEMDSLSGKEDTLSEKICPILSQVCHELYQTTKKEVSTPYWEAPIQPVLENELKGGKVRKRPDFTCKRLNPYADSPGEYEISLHIECKRLGNPTSDRWILNENYVVEGIQRFDCKTHEYGKRAPSGIMIGYIISMTPEKINIEVNKFQNKHLPANVPITFDFNQAMPFQTRQGIKRQNVLPSQFELIHLWIDLRKSYQP